jgi:LmbE family N-acetylglucosaminyl deacetylase
MMGHPVLVVAAHPDDEVLGVGAAMARHVGNGDAVTVLILGEGITSRQADREAAGPAVKALQERARAANRVLGVSDVRFEGLPDNRFDGLDLLDLVKLVERAVDELGPTTVYTHHPGDLNVDHRLTFQAVLTATRPVPGAPVTEVLAFEVPSSTDWAFGRSGPAFSPNHFVDVTAFLSAKLEALAAYGDEIRPAPHARSIEAVRSAAVRWGSAVGRGAAEAFEVVRVIR